MTKAATLPVVETFHSLQGEGHHSGRSAFFIRLAGCTVGCPWCDTKHSWPPDHHPHMPLAALAEEAAEACRNGAAFTVVTGGEPLHHALAPLTHALSVSGRPLHLETSGVDALSGQFDWITLSPKRHRPPRADLLRHCHELKVVIHSTEDLAFAESMAAATGDKALLMLQPGWDSPSGQQLAVDHARSNPRWRLSLQTHKWLGVR